jgi:hypothetical protein
MTVTSAPINIDEHHCSFPGCTGTIWRESHVLDNTTATTGRRDDVLDGLAATVMATYDEREDVGPRILLHLGSESGQVDVDVSPTPAEARRIAIKLLEAADAHDSWTAVKRSEFHG